MIVFNLLAALVELYVFLLIAWAILSWIPTDPHSGFAHFHRGLGRIIEPVLRPVRRVIPPVGGRIDLSPLIVLLVAELIVIPLLKR